MQPFCGAEHCASVVASEKGVASGGRPVSMEVSPPSSPVAPPGPPRAFPPQDAIPSPNSSATTRLTDLPDVVLMATPHPTYSPRDTSCTPPAPLSEPRNLASLGRTARGNRQGYEVSSEDSFHSATVGPTLLTALMGVVCSKSSGRRLKSSDSASERRKLDRQGPGLGLRSPSR
jgi:hypothetical protein